MRPQRKYSNLLLWPKIWIKTENTDPKGPVYNDGTLTGCKLYLRIQRMAEKRSDRGGSVPGEGWLIGAEQLSLWSLLRRSAAGWVSQPAMCFTFYHKDCKDNWHPSGFPLPPLDSWIYTVYQAVSLPSQMYLLWAPSLTMDTFWNITRSKTACGFCCFALFFSTLNKIIRRMKTHISAFALSCLCCGDNPWLSESCCSGSAAPPTFKYMPYREISDGISTRLSSIIQK